MGFNHHDPIIELCLTYDNIHYFHLCLFRKYIFLIYTQYTQLYILTIIKYYKINHIVEIFSYIYIYIFDLLSINLSCQYNYMAG